jgi:hypothetical protein
VVNVGIKSGTNSIHGTAYAYDRDDSFDVRNYFNSAPAPKTPIALEQFGASLGGPIKKDKLFYFLSYEINGIRWPARSNIDFRSRPPRAEMQRRTFSLPASLR